MLGKPRHCDFVHCIYPALLCDLNSKAAWFRPRRVQGLPTLLSCSLPCPACSVLSEGELVSCRGVSELPELLNVPETLQQSGERVQLVGRH